MCGAPGQERPLREALHRSLDRIGNGSG